MFHIVKDILRGDFAIVSDSETILSSERCHAAFEGSTLYGAESEEGLPMRKIELPRPRSLIFVLRRKSGIAIVSQ